jgi:hypothetical protein
MLPRDTGSGEPLAEPTDMFVSVVAGAAVEPVFWTVTMAW